MVERRGFFTAEKTQARLDKDGCLACGLDRTCLTPKMFATGEGQKGLLVIAEAPGADEDKRGKQLVGEAGQTLRKVLAKKGIELDRDCRKINAVNCRPPKNRTPDDKEIEYCRPNVWEEINNFKPKVILLLGGAALGSFLGHRWHESLGGITKWRGFAIPDRTANAWVMATNHPSYVNRMDHQPVVAHIFEQDIALAVSLLKKPVPQYDSESNHVKLISIDSIIPALDDLMNTSDPLLAFDFETSGRKPQAKGHFIRCMSMCWRDDYSIAFEMPLIGSDEHKMIVRILGNRIIRKTAHNMKFEDTWAREIMGATVRNWWFDSMLAAHVLDNRRGINGLDFQLYVNFGTPDYYSHMSQYLESDDKKNANSFNKVQDAPLDDLLMYCGIDSFGQRRLALKQARELGL